MFRNPYKVRELSEKIESLQTEVKAIKMQLCIEKKLPPVGYQILGAGTTIKQGALYFSHAFETWRKVNVRDIGKNINDQGHIISDSQNLDYRLYIWANKI